MTNNDSIKIIIYIELLRRGHDVKIGFINKKKIDFVCTKYKEKIYIQVTYQLEMDKTIERDCPLLIVSHN